MGNNKIWLFIGILLAILFSVGYLLLATKKPQESKNGTAQEVPTASPQEEDGEVKEITVVGKEYSFEPSVITVSPGQKVRIIYKNGGASLHNLVIAQIGVTSKTIGPGEEDMIEFVAPEKGTYEIYCSIGTHRHLGMTGSLEVK